MHYFEGLKALLQKEKQEDLQQYSRFTASAPAAKRRAEGWSWYPVAIRGTDIGRGDYLAVELERTTHQDISHQFRFGASVALFSNHNPSEDRLEGVISYQGGDRMKISLRVDELPDWCSDGKLGVDLLFDDNSYTEMEKALSQAEERLQENDHARLIKILTGQAEPDFEPAKEYPTHNHLNESQREAVAHIVAAKDLAIVHGPPGTGKTTTLVAAILEMKKQAEGRILVCAASNTAVDLLSEKLSAAGLDVVRVGNPARVSEQLNALTLDAKISGHRQMKEIKNLKKQVAEFRNMAQKYKRNFGKAERDQRKALLDEAKKIIKEVGNTERYIMDDVLGRADIVAATLVGSNHYTVRDLRYHTVVIDEAGQAPEPACWIPVLKAEKLVLAGDHLQLPPTIKSMEAAREGLAETMMEKNVHLHPEAVSLLEVQYRMHEQIMAYPAAHFYEGKLTAHESVAAQTLQENIPPFEFIDTAGCGFEEKADGTSTINSEEASFVLKHLSTLVAGISTSEKTGAHPSIAVIAPYKQQVEVLKEQALHDPLLASYKGSFAINTVDSFQGQERDIVYISMTRSNADGVIGFLSDIRRMNVAMTRARKRLVIIGDSATIAAHPFYAGLIAYAEKQEAYHSAWEYMDV